MRDVSTSGPHPLSVRTYRTMTGPTGTWQTLRLLLREARSVADYKEDIFRYVTLRYSEHQADELRDKMKSLRFGDFRQYVATEFMDSGLDAKVDALAKAAVAAHAARQATPTAPDDPRHVRGPSGRTFTDPKDAAKRQARIDAMKKARSDAGTGGMDALRQLMSPGRSGTHAVGTAGQHRPKQQPSVAAGMIPDRSADDLKKMRVARSGIVRAQRLVDKETREKGAAAGEKLAKTLGVPTTAERTTVHPDTGEKRIQVWGPDRVFKHMDSDSAPVDDDDDLDAAPPFLRGVAGQADINRAVSLRGADLGTARTDAARKAQSQRRAADAVAGRIDPERLEKIKAGILQRNAASTKVGPDRPGSFHGERWKPHGREQQQPTARPDQMTGNWVHGMVTVNPKHTGKEAIWNDHAGVWQLPSVFASAEAERGAAMRTAPPAKDDFEDDERTVQDVNADIDGDSEDDRG